MERPKGIFVKIRHNRVDWIDFRQLARRLQPALGQSTLNITPMMPPLEVQERGDRLRSPSYEDAYRCAEKIYRAQRAKAEPGNLHTDRLLEPWELNEIKEIAVIIRTEVGIALPSDARPVEQCLANKLKRDETSRYWRK